MSLKDIWDWLINADLLVGLTYVGALLLISVGLGVVLGILNFLTEALNSLLEYLSNIRLKLVLKLYYKTPKFMAKLYSLVLWISVISISIFFIALIFVWANAEVPALIFMSSLIVCVCAFILAKLIKCP